MNIEGKLEVHPLPSDGESVADDAALRLETLRGRRNATLEVYGTSKVLEIEELLRHCRDGRRIIVTSRGIPVAMIRPFRRRSERAFPRLLRKRVPDPALRRFQ